MVTRAMRRFVEFPLDEPMNARTATTKVTPMLLMAKEFCASLDTTG